MSRGVNSCTFIGNVGKDPETRFIPNGNAVTNFSIAVGKKYKDKNGNPQEHTEWVRIVAFGRLGEICGEYLQKGAQVYICGEMKTNKWEKDGQTRYSTEIIANEVQFLGVKGETSEVPQGGAPQQDDDFNSDIPF